MDKTIVKVQTYKDAEGDCIFHPSVPLGKRLEEAWILTCRAYGIDPLSPPKMEKHIFSARKHCK